MPESLCDPQYLKFRWWNVFELAAYWLIATLILCYDLSKARPRSMPRLFRCACEGGAEGAKEMLHKRKFSMYKDPRCPECMSQLPELRAAHDCPADPQKWGWVVSRGFRLISSQSDTSNTSAP